MNCSGVVGLVGFPHNINGDGDSNVICRIFHPLRQLLHLQLVGDFLPMFPYYILGFVKPGNQRLEGHSMLICVHKGDEFLLCLFCGTDVNVRFSLPL
jgi:hypothetical protein